MHNAGIKGRISTTLLWVHPLWNRSKRPAVDRLLYPLRNRNDRYGTARCEKISRVADELPMNADNLRCFSIGVHPRSLGHPLDSHWKDYEMRKGVTRKPHGDAPATRAKNYITPTGTQR